MTPRPTAVTQTEISTIPTDAPALGRGDRITLQATVIRFVGPWVQLQILGENVQVLRSTLDKEIRQP